MGALRRLSGVVALLLASCPLPAHAASLHDFRFEARGTVLSDVQKEGMFLELGGVQRTECRVSRFWGEEARVSADSVAIHPSYRGCRFAGRPVSVRAGGCAYVFDAASVGDLAQVQVRCAPGKRIEMAIAGLCTIAIPPQTVSEAAAYDNSGRGSSRRVDVTVAMADVGYQRLGGIGCLFAGNGQEGRIEMGITLFGHTAATGGPAGIWLN